MRSWFKYLLFGLIVISGLISLFDVRKGNYVKEQKAITNALAAVVDTLLAIGIWCLL